MNQSFIYGLHWCAVACLLVFYGVLDWMMYACVYFYGRIFMYIYTYTIRSNFSIKDLKNLWLLIAINSICLGSSVNKQ